MEASPAAANPAPVVDVQSNETANPALAAVDTPEAPAADSESSESEDIEFPDTSIDITFGHSNSVKIQTQPSQELSRQTSSAESVTQRQSSTSSKRLSDSFALMMSMTRCIARMSAKQRKQLKAQKTKGETASEQVSLCERSLWCFNSQSQTAVKSPKESDSDEEDPESLSAKPTQKKPSDTADKPASQPAAPVGGGRDCCCGCLALAKPALFKISLFHS